MVQLIKGSRILVNEDKLTDEQICAQLLELAQTPEQVKYLTGNNQAVLTNKLEEYKREMNIDLAEARELRQLNRGKEQAYLKAIVELANWRQREYDY